jgi:hypothetical protein
MTRTALTLLVPLLLPSAACDTTRVSEPAGDVQVETAALAVVGANVDLTGVWSWHEKTHIHVRQDYVGLFGIAPVGPVTHLICESSGQDLVIAQNGAGFSGQTSQSSACTVPQAPGVTPVPPFPPALTLVDGHIRGRSIRFTLDTGGFPCSYHGSVRVLDGVATEIRATGSCAVPADIGTDEIVEWRAVRP